MTTLGGAPGRRRLLPPQCLVLGLVIAMNLTGCGRIAGDAGTQSDPGSTGSISVVETYLDPGQRTQPVTLAGTTIDGQAWSNAVLTKQVLVVNVWASWCGPCRAEAPILRALSLKYAPKGVAFVGVDTRDSDINGQAFTRTFNIPYPSLSDRSGQLLLALSALPPSAIPSTLVLDRQGRVAGRIIGPVTGGGLGGLIERVAAEARR